MKPKDASNIDKTLLEKVVREEAGIVQGWPQTLFLQARSIAKLNTQIFRHEVVGYAVASEDPLVFYVGEKIYYVIRMTREKTSAKYLEKKIEGENQ